MARGEFKLGSGQSEKRTSEFASPSKRQRTKRGALTEVGSKMIPAHPEIFWAEPPFSLLRRVDEDHRGVGRKGNGSARWLMRGCGTQMKRRGWQISSSRLNMSVTATHCGCAVSPAPMHSCSDA
jgi:hypothetical protein